MSINLISVSQTLLYSATGVFKLLGDVCNNNNNVETNEQLKETELIATCLEYVDVLHNEFLFSPPCQPLAFAIKNTIRFLSEQGIFSMVSQTEHNAIQYNSFI
jgi:hypothetical protein